MSGPLFIPSAKDLAALFGVSVRTVRRWRQRSKCPPAVEMVLSRDLGVFDPLLKGWTVRDGEFISPENWCIGISEVRTVPIMREQIAAYRATVKQLRDEIKLGIEEQPLPSEWPLEIFGTSD